MSSPVLVRVSSATKRHYDHSFFKGKHLIGWLTVSEICFIIITAGCVSVQADMELGKEPRNSHLAGSRK